MHLRGMRTLGLLLLVLLGIGLFAEAGHAGPCPLHASDATREMAAPATNQVKEAIEHPASEIGTVSSSHVPDAGSKPHHPLFGGQLCCHGAVGFGLALGIPLEQPRGPRRGSVLVSWQPPYASPTADIFRPPRNA